MEYFLSKLNDREFESLCADIISKYLALQVEKFKSGKDGGVDGRFWIGNQEGILQCKHYAKTGYKGLISKLKSEEVQKVRKLNPVRYILITSVPLSRENKIEILGLFSPFIKSQVDIWGEDDINSFLLDKNNQEIVERNYKLWITSTIVTDLLLNSAIKGRSKSTLKEITSNNEKYVITDNHIKGAKILKEKNVVIISGEPGIGKTTLANNLALYYIANGFEFCDIEESLSEAEALFREEEKKKIIFYCDDFLGSNMLDAISNKRDSHIVKFIERVKNDNSKKFILTSRTNILNKAVSLSHQFQNKNLAENEFLLKVENLSEIDKAKILYNHLFHANLDSEFIDEIYHEKRYRILIKHRNFNPRIIEFVTDYRKIDDLNPHHYWEYVVNKFNNPEDIWKTYFQHQIDESVRVLSYLTVFNDGKIQEVELRNAYSKFKNNYGIHTQDHTDNSFNSVVKLGIKSLLNRKQIKDNEFEFTLFNPSIGDFIINEYKDDIDLIIKLLKSLESEKSITLLSSLERNKKISESDLQKIQFELFNTLYNKKLNDKEWDYLILLSYIDFFNPKISDKVRDLIINISESEDIEQQRLYELVTIIVEVIEVDKIQDFSFVLGFIDYNETTDCEIGALLRLIKKFNITDQFILTTFSDIVEVFINKELNNNLDSIDLGKFIHYDTYNDYKVYKVVDKDEIYSEMESLVDSILTNFDDDLLDYAEINMTFILENTNIQQAIDNYDYSFDYDDEFGGKGFNNLDSENDIDNLFER